MTVRIGINGFGRMGRLVLRAGWQSSELSFVHVNETKGGVGAAAHLLKFDSVHGRWPLDVREEAQQICIDSERVSFSECAAPGAVPWDASRRLPGGHESSRAGGSCIRLRRSAPSREAGRPAGAAGSRGDPIVIFPVASTAGPDVHAGQSESFMQTVEDSFRLVRADECAKAPVVDESWKCAI